MFDVQEIFKSVSVGGAPAIFLLLIFISLILSGVLRVKREIESVEGLNSELLARIDKQQLLFERSLDLLERQLDGVPNRERSRRRASGD